MSQLNFSIGTFSQCMSFSPQDIKIDNFEDYTLYCIDCENVQQFDTNTLKATSPSVFFFFGNFEKIGQKCWQQIFAIAKDFPNSYCFNTHQSQKNFADIYCATLLGQIVANIVPKKFFLSQMIKDFKVLNKPCCSKEKISTLKSYRQETRSCCL